MFNMHDTARLEGGRMFATGRIVTAKMAAKRLGVSRQRVWQLVRCGVLSRVVVDETPFIGETSLELLLRYREEKAQQHDDE